MYANNSHMAWHDRLDSARLALQFSNKRLAKLTGISESSISDYMHGKREPEYARLQAICKVLSISPGYVLDETTPAGSLEELVAWDAFLKFLQKPPQADTEWARDLGHYSSPQAISHHEHADRPGDPPFAGRSLAGPPRLSGPPQVEFQDFPTESEPVSPPKGNRKPL